MGEYDKKMQEKLEADYRQTKMNQKVVKKQLHDYKVNHIK
jgi:hypothetical protein